jgi:hypothetical protein
MDIIPGCAPHTSVRVFSEEQPLPDGVIINALPFLDPPPMPRNTFVTVHTRGFESVTVPLEETEGMTMDDLPKLSVRRPLN